MSKYQRIISRIPEDKRMYIHYQSVYGFIVHANTMSEWDCFETENKIKEYLEIVEEDISNIDSYMGLELFKLYIYPMGEKLKKYGFSRVVPMKYLFLYSVLIDSLIFIVSFPYLFPITSFLVAAYYFLVRKKMYKSNKAYGLFY